MLDKPLSASEAEELSAIIKEYKAVSQRRFDEKGRALKTLYMSIIAISTVLAEFCAAAHNTKEARDELISLLGHYVQEQTEKNAIIIDEITRKLMKDE